MGAKGMGSQNPGSETHDTGEAPGTQAEHLISFPVRNTQVQIPASPLLLT